MTPLPGARGDRGGFVLVFVVFMLFAVSVAAATGYLVVSTDFGMAKHSSDGAEALTVARAGLERFVAEQLGVVDDSVTYALGGGVALVTSRKLFQKDSVTDVYFIRSEGTVADIFALASPARRVVGAYATHRKRPLPHLGTVVLSAQTVQAQNGGTIYGNDYSTAGDCPGGGTAGITGAIARSNVLEDGMSDVDGNPRARLWPGGYTQILDSIAIRWDVLSDPDFPIEFDGVWPNFGSLPVDSFPVVRMSGFLSTSQVGRGVLIVDGTFDPTSGFRWDGIVLARDIDDYVEGDIRGIVVAGLNADNFYPTVNWRGIAAYNACYVYAANESLSYLELVENTVFEVY